MERFEDRRTNWNKITTLLAQIFNVPCALIMHKHERTIEVFSKSNNKENPYHQKEMANLDTGLYCETVMAKRNLLVVPNALRDSKWDHNPDIELGMISYMGLPIIDPNGKVFGTICVLDNKENPYSAYLTKLLVCFKNLVEDDMKKTHINTLLIEKKNELIEHKEIALQQVISACANTKNEILDTIHLNVHQNITPLMNKMIKNCENGSGRCLEHFQLLKKFMATIDIKPKKSADHHKLSASEIKVYNMVKEGLIHKEIAHILNISTNTVKNHVRSIKNKLHISNSKNSLKTYLSQEF